MKVRPQSGFMTRIREGVSMSDLQGTSNPQRKEQVVAADRWFVVFVIIITTIAVTLTLTQIYLQNPK
jgi:hypothetical protein